MVQLRVVKKIQRNHIIPVLRDLQDIDCIFQTLHGNSLKAGAEILVLVMDLDLFYPFQSRHRTAVYLRKKGLDVFPVIFILAYCQGKLFIHPDEPAIGIQKGIRDAEFIQKRLLHLSVLGGKGNQIVQDQRPVPEDQKQRQHSEKCKETGNDKSGFYRDGIDRHIHDRQDHQKNHRPLHIRLQFSLIFDFRLFHIQLLHTAAEKSLRLPDTLMDAYLPIIPFF